MVQAERSELLSECDARNGWGINQFLYMTYASNYYLSDQQKTSELLKWMG
jgi:hypothetical protein